MRRLAAALVFAVVGGAAGAADAADRTAIDPQFYQATAIVTGYDLRSRPAGFASCLREVLVKVSGDARLRDDPRVATLAAHADAAVAGFGYVDPMAAEHHHDDQGTYDRSYDLTVRFIPARIDAMLAALGARPWRGTRPVLVPVVAVRDRKQARYLLDASNPQAADQRAAFVNAATADGIAIRFPTAAELAVWHARADHVPAPPATPGTVIVAGTLTWSETAPGWRGAWRMRWHGRDHAWRIDGVSFDKAFKNLVGGAVLLASGSGGPG